MAYQPTKEDPQFLIRHVASKVNNSSNTVLYSGASDKAGRRAINHLAKNHRYHITSINYVTGMSKLAMAQQPQQMTQPILAELFPVNWFTCTAR